MGWFTDHPITKVYYLHQMEHIDAEHKTDTLQIDNELVASTTKLINETYFGDTPMATTTVTIYPTLSGQSGITSVGTNGLGGIAGSYNQYTSAAGQPILQSPQYYYTAGQSAGQPVFMLPQQGHGTPVYHAGLDAYVLVNEIPSRSEFTEDEIEQAERIMEELSHA